ncbi:response regulator [Celerinatantimonas diazotrophica]|uniref:Transcriptional regulatory protein n=1 Tax=Celerinatantimonas diazotrophica TaxID=412034 RepID=A0A4R1K3X5_9GAMM|nr:response regulator [Celerinatantimonas diazotrophica]TCK58794.1 two-component system response regulator CitB [Celerinatantimonas diazotrophica]CAG9297426.1 Transcriptional regulatory protein DpiA [Celerinatantimonas diazotrophica]
MMEQIDVLIIEDEPNIAEIHNFYLQRMNRFRPVGVAKTVADARNMIRILKPKLILLDNFLPDGKGIELLKELTSVTHPADVIFITAASDMDTVREAVRCGVFDYLLKPIAYDRLEDSLERYLKYISSLKANDNVNQRHVDELFNFQAKTQHLEALPKGIDELTLEKLKEIYFQHDQAYTAESLGKAIGISKTTARRYLEYCVNSGFLEAQIVHGKVGRPERVYQKKR